VQSLWSLLPLQLSHQYSSANLEAQASEFLEDAIRTLPRGKRDTGIVIFQEFLQCWNELRKKFETYIQCGHELEQNSEIPQFFSKDENPEADPNFLG
jgi:hypothetical protein